MMELRELPAGLSGPLAAAGPQEVAADGTKPVPGASGRRPELVAASVFAGLLAAAGQAATALSVAESTGQEPSSSGEGGQAGGDAPGARSMVMLTAAAESARPAGAGNEEQAGARDGAATRGTSPLPPSGLIRAAGPPLADGKSSPVLPADVSPCPTDERAQPSASGDSAGYDATAAARTDDGGEARPQPPSADLSSAGPAAELAAGASTGLVAAAHTAALTVPVHVTGADSVAGAGSDSLVLLRGLAAGTHAGGGGTLASLGPTAASPSGGTAVADVPAQLRGRILGQVLDRIVASGEQGDGNQQLRLELDPPQLGRVTVGLETNGDRLTVTFTAASPQVEAALRESADELVEALMAPGARWSQVHVRLAPSGESSGRGGDATQDEGDGSPADGGERRQGDARGDQQRTGR